MHLSAAFTLCLLSTASAQLDITSIAVGNRPAPGLPGITLASPTLLAVSPAGHVLYQSTLANVALPTDTAIFTHAQGTARIVARENDPAAGLAAGSLYDTFRTIRIDSAGRVAFTARTRGTTAIETIYQELTPGSASLIAVLGQRPPLFTAGAFSEFKQLWLANDGALSFVGDATGTNPGGRSLFSYVNGVGRFYARQGDPAPFVSPTAGFIFGNNTTEFIMAGANEVGIFRAAAGGIIFAHGAPGQLQTAVRTGITPPNLLAPRTVSDLRGVCIGEDGTAAITVGVSNPAASALYVGRPGNITLAALAGDPVPNYTPAATYTDFPSPLNAGYPGNGLAVGPAGHVLFRAVIREGSSVSTREALFLRSPDGTIQFIAANGRAMGSTTVVATTITSLSYHVNRRGDVLFAVTNPQRGNVIVSWSRERGYTILLSETQAIRIDGGAVQAIAPASLSLRSAQNDAAPLILQPILADDGTFAFFCRLAGSNTPAILTMQLPQPCDSIDFNQNGVFPEDQDVIDFFNVLAGGDCPTCNDIDFNNNQVFPEDADVIDFFTVLAGGNCS